MNNNPDSLETDEATIGSIVLQWATRKHRRTLTLGEPSSTGSPSGDGGLAGGRSGDDGLTPDHVTHSPEHLRREGTRIRA
ncbi:hypothetical protein AB6813_01070 [bacterium RCC_150]